MRTFTRFHALPTLNYACYNSETGISGLS